MRLLPTATVMSNCSGDKLFSSSSVVPMTGKPLTLPWVRSSRKTISPYVPSAAASSATTLPCPPAPITEFAIPRERGHGGFPLRRNAFFNQDFFDCQKQDFHIQPKAEIVGVPNIAGELFVPRKRVAPVDLRPAGNARFHFVAAVLKFVVKRQILHQKRAGADQAHLAFEDVPQFRQFVQTGGAQFFCRRA